MGDSQWWKQFFVLDEKEGGVKFWESEEQFKEMRKPDGEIEQYASLGGEHLNRALPPRTPLSIYSRVGRLLSSWNAAFTVQIRSLSSSGEEPDHSKLV